MMKKLLDLLMLPALFLSANLMKFIRSKGVSNYPKCKSVLLKIGVYPIRDHFYEPRFNFSESDIDFSKERYLPGIDWNQKNQLLFLEKMIKTPGRYSLEKKLNLPNGREFNFNNNAFESGDAEFWYQFIKTIKPNRIIEIGSGYSTLIATHAIRDLKKNHPEYDCNHQCIEPYLRPWLESLNINIIRKKVESINLPFFSELKEGDILFIDSSHIIRPGGDVLFEYLEIIPSLNPGVYVHIHDIFSPRDYLKKWVIDDVRLWNEQYLLESFLSHNSEWKIVAALNWLHHNHYNKMKEICPYLELNRQPGSFYIQRAT